MSAVKSAVSPLMGAIPTEQGVSFRVWAPFAKEVAVVGSFNDWDAKQHPLQPEGEGQWVALVPKAKVGDEYRFWLKTESGEELTRIDPYAREVTNSVGNGVIFDASFEWEDDSFALPPMNELVIYELHIGTFLDPQGDGSGTFATAARRLEHLRKLGVNAIEILPIAEVPGERSWGYNPAHIFAVESSYGGPLGFKKFVKKCHQLGIGVILDVVYNHFGPTDLDLWRFDGWHQNDLGGIYFYNDFRANTPWGDTRPDYGRPEVRRFLRDNAFMWLEEFRVDGLRYDSTLYMRTIDGERDLPEAWELFRGLNGEIRSRLPHKLLIAEDLRDSAKLTDSVENQGGGFHSQWCAHFVHPVRGAVITPADEHRDMGAVAQALVHRFNHDVFQRVIYSESHDEVANGHQRVVSEVSPDDPQNWFARKRSTLAGALALTGPGIPMLFQGQETLEPGWFEDTVPLDWDLREEYSGIVRLYRDLIALRRNKSGQSRGLTGQGIDVYRIDDEKNVLAFRRFDQGGPGDDVIVVANFSHDVREGFRIGLPAAGTWHVRFSSDDRRYSPDYHDEPNRTVEAEAMEWDQMPHSAEFRLPGYSLLLLSQ